LRCTAAPTPRLLGKPVSLGCARATDAGPLELIRLLEQQRALQRPSRSRAASCPVLPPPARVSSASSRQRDRPGAFRSLRALCAQAGNSTAISAPLAQCADAFSEACVGV
jgi:hypothetical protein